MNMMTDEQKAALRAERERYGAVGQNAVVYSDGTVVHFPNTEQFKDCLFRSNLPADEPTTAQNH